MANPLTTNDRLGRMHTLERTGFPWPLSCAAFGRQVRDRYRETKLADPARMPHVKAHRRPQRRYVEINPVTTARRATLFAASLARTGEPVYQRAMRAVFFLADGTRHDRNPRVELAGLQAALDNFTGYCGEDDAIGDKIAYLTRFEYVFRPDLYGTEYTPRAW